VPTYQYACTECGHQLEAVQSFADDPLTVCPACEGRLRKVFNSVGVVFKGSGFYRTDSRNGANGGTKAKPESTPDTKTESKTETKTESKPKAEPAKAATPSAA
jgi:putative FmdB family regulatory protein